VTYDIEANGIPKFVKTDFIELQKIQRISKFRSGSGHNYSDDFESCRSMKHYFSLDSEMGSTLNHISNVFSPINGKITKIFNESGGNGGVQLWISSNEYAAIMFKIFHVNKNSTVTVGKNVVAGENLGTTYSTDIVVEVYTNKGYKLVSYFDVMNDSLFTDYKKRGLNSRADIIISKEARDAHPIQCTGDEQFPNQYDTFYQDWIFLK
jgi:hypothetical protein